jgi:ribosome-binding protein aMBF1 (putative translation factor)
MIDIAARFGDNLARERKRADLSQEELAVVPQDIPNTGHRRAVAES